jgi:ABC-type phosphate transport system substrate-binding protein
MKFGIALLLAFLLALSAWARAAEPAAKGVVVILHPSNGTSAMDRSQLAQIYKGVRRSWNSQLRISVLLPPATSPAMAALASSVFKLPRPEDVSTFYANAVQRKIFAAQPAILSSDAEVVKRVAAEPGAIGVVDASQIADPASVKVLVVEGL